MQTTIPNVDVELIRRRFDQVTGDLNLCTSRAGNRGPDARELGKCIQSFTQLMEQIVSDYGTHPQHVVGQHVCCNTVIMALEYAVKPALSRYCSTAAAATSLVSAPHVLQSRATHARIHISQGEALLLANVDGPRQAKKAQALRQEVVRPFAELVLTLHRGLPLEPLTEANEQAPHRRADGSGAVNRAAHITGGGHNGSEGMMLPSGSNELSASVMAMGSWSSSSSAASILAAGLTPSAGSSGSGPSGTSSSSIFSTFAMSSILSPQFTTAALPSTAPLLWKHAEPLRVLTEHVLEVLESEVLSAVIGQEYASLLVSLLSFDSYARAVPTSMVRAIMDRTLTLLERVETNPDPQGNARADIVMTTATASPTSHSSSTSSSTATTAVLYAVSSDEGVLYMRLLRAVLALPQFTTSFRAIYQLDNTTVGTGRTVAPHASHRHPPTPARAPLHDPESMEDVMHRLCSVLRHWHQHPSSTLNLEATGLQALTRLMTVIARDYPTVADEPLDLIKPLCDACYRAETLRRDHWRLEVYACVMVQVCHHFTAVLSRHVPQDNHLSFMGNAQALARSVLAARDNQTDDATASASSLVRAIPPRALLLLHETVLPLALQLVGQRHHEYSFMSRRDLFYFPCTAVQEVFDFSAVVIYVASCTHDAYVLARRCISREGGGGSDDVGVVPQQVEPLTSRTGTAATTTSTGPFASHDADSARREAGVALTFLRPEERLLRSLRIAFGGEAEPHTPSAGLFDRNGTETTAYADDRTFFTTLSTPPSWLLSTLGGGGSTSSSAFRDGAGTAAAGSVPHISSLSDAALFNLHLFAQPCTTLHWTAEACDALVVAHLCPLFSVFGAHLSRLLTAALEASIARCTSVVQQRVFQWVVAQAMPRPLMGTPSTRVSSRRAGDDAHVDVADDDDAARVHHGTHTAASPTRTAMTDTLMTASAEAHGGGAGQEGLLAPQSFWYALLSVMLDRAVLGQWSVCLPHLPLRALFLNAMPARTFSSAEDARRFVTRALAKTQRAIAPWCQRVHGTRRALAHGQHYAFISAQVERLLVSRERDCAERGQPPRRGVTTHGHTDSESEPHGGPAATTSASTSTPHALLSDAINATTAVSSLLSPVLFLHMVRVLAAAEACEARDVTHRGVYAVEATEPPLTPAKQRQNKDLARVLLSDDASTTAGDANCRPRHKSTVKSDEGEADDGACDEDHDTMTRAEVPRRRPSSVPTRGSAVLANVHDALEQYATAQASQLLHVLDESDTAPSLDRSLLFINDAFAHASCVHRPAREDGVRLQLLEHHQRRLDALHDEANGVDANGHNTTTAAGRTPVTTASAVLMNAPMSGRGVYRGGTDDASGLSALLSHCGQAGGVMGSMASSSSTGASSSSFSATGFGGFVQAQMWGAWSAMLDEAESYVLLAVRRACGLSTAHAERQFHERLLRRYIPPQRSVPPAVSYAAEGQWLLRYPTASTLSDAMSATASTRMDRAAPGDVDGGERDGADADAKAARVPSAGRDLFAVYTPRVWLTAAPVLNTLSATVTCTFKRFVRRVHLARAEARLFTRSRPSVRQPWSSSASAWAGAHGEGGDVADTFGDVEDEVSSQLHAVLCVQSAQLLQWLVRLYKQGLWAPPCAEVEDDAAAGAGRRDTGHAREAAKEASGEGGVGGVLWEDERQSSELDRSSDAQDLHVLRTTPTSVWFSRPQPTLDELSASGRIFFVVLWLARYLHEHLGVKDADEDVDGRKTRDERRHRTTPTTTTARPPLPSLSLVSSRAALLALLHMYQDVGDVLLHARLACADPGQVILCFSGSLARRLLEDGVRQLLGRWRPTNVLAQELLLPVMETAQVSLRLLMSIMWTVKRTRVLASSVDPFVDAAEMSDTVVDLLSNASLLAPPASASRTRTGVNGWNPFLPFFFPLLEPVLQMLLWLRFDFDSRPARDAYWHVMQTVYFRYASAATPSLFRVIGSTPSLFLSGVLASTRVGGSVDRGGTAAPPLTASRLTHFISYYARQQDMDRDGALLQWLVHLVEGRDPTATATANRSTLRQLLPDTTQTAVPSSAPLTPALESTMLSATFRLLPLCREDLSEQLGRHTFSSLSADAAYAVRRHAAMQIHVLFRLFSDRGERVLQDLLHVCRSGILSSNPLLCATSLLALAEAAKAAPWLETNVVYTLLECWATRGFCFRGQVLECLQSIAESGTASAAPFNTRMGSSRGRNRETRHSASDSGAVSEDTAAMSDMVDSITGDGHAWLERLLARQERQTVGDIRICGDAAHVDVDTANDHEEDHPKASGANEERDDAEADSRRPTHSRKRPREETTRDDAVRTASPSSSYVEPSAASVLLPAFAAACQSNSRVLLFRWLWDFRHSLDALPFLCFGCASLDELVWEHAPCLLTLSLVLSAPWLTAAAEARSAGGVAVRAETGNDGVFGGGGDEETNSGHRVRDRLLHAVKCAWRRQYSRVSRTRTPTSTATAHTKAPGPSRRRREDDEAEDAIDVEDDAHASSLTSMELTVRLIVLCFAPLVAQLVLLASRASPRAGEANDGDALLGLDAIAGGRRARHGGAAGDAEVRASDEATAALSDAAEAALYWVQTVLNGELEERPRLDSLLRDVRPELCQANSASTAWLNTGSAPFSVLLHLESDRILSCMVDLYSRDGTTPLADMATLDRGMERVADWLWSSSPSSGITASTSATSVEETLLRTLLTETGNEEEAVDVDVREPPGRPSATRRGERTRLFLFQHWLRRSGGDAACGLLQYVFTQTMTPPSSAHALASVVFLPPTFFNASATSSDPNTDTLKSAGDAAAQTRVISSGAWYQARWAPRVFFRSSLLEDRLVLLRHLVVYWLPPTLLCTPSVLQSLLMIVLRLLQVTSPSLPMACEWSAEAVEYVRAVACDMILHVWPIITARTTIVSATAAATEETHAKGSDLHNGASPQSSATWTVAPSASRARVLLLRSLDSTLATTMMTLATESAVVSSTWTILCRVDVLLLGCDWRRLRIRYAAAHPQVGDDEEDDRAASDDSASDDVSGVEKNNEDEEAERYVAAKGDDNDENDVVIVDVDGDQTKPKHKTTSSSRAERASRRLSRRRRDTVSFLLSLLERVRFVVDGGGASAARYLRELANALDVHRDTLVEALRRSAAPCTHQTDGTQEDASAIWACHVRQSLTHALHYLLRMSLHAASASSVASAAPSRTVVSAATPVSWAGASGLGGGDTSTASAAQDDLALGAAFTARTVPTLSTASSSSSSAMWMATARPTAHAALERFNLLRSLSWCFIEVGEGWLIERQLIQESAQGVGWSVLPNLSELIPRIATEEHDAVRYPARDLILVPSSLPGTASAAQDAVDAATPAHSHTRPARSPMDVIRAYLARASPLGAALDEVMGLHYAQLFDTLESLSRSVGVLTAALAARALRAVLSLEEPHAAAAWASFDPAHDDTTDKAARVSRGDVSGDDEEDAPRNTRDDACDGLVADEEDGTARNATSGALRRRSVLWRNRVARRCTTVDGLLVFLAKDAVFRYATAAADETSADEGGHETAYARRDQPTLMPLLDALTRWPFFRFRRATTFDEVLLRNMLPEARVFDAIVGDTDSLSRNAKTTRCVRRAATLVSCTPLSLSSTTAHAASVSGKQSPPRLHVLDEALWLELDVFRSEASFLPLFVLALIETYRLDDHVDILARVKPLLRAEAAAATAASTLALLTGSHTAQHLDESELGRAHDMVVAADSTDHLQLQRAALRARRRQLRTNGTPFWLCLVGLAGGAAADAQTAESPLIVNARVLERLHDGLDDEQANSTNATTHTVSATLLPLVFLHLMLQTESTSARALRRDWSVRLDTYVIMQSRRYPQLTRLLLRTLYEGCYGPLAAAVKITGLRGFKPSKGAVEAAGDRTLGVPHTTLLGTLPLLSTMREVYWLADIPALHLAHAATAVKEPYLAVLFAELSGESVLTIDAAGPSGRGRDPAQPTPSHLQTGADGRLVLSALSTAMHAVSAPDGGTTEVGLATGDGDVEVNGGLPVTLAILSGVDGRRGDMLWLRDASSASQGTASALFPSRAGRGATSSSAASSSAMQTSSKSRRARLDAREAALQTRFFCWRRLLMPVFVNAHGWLPTCLEGRQALATHQLWDAEASLAGVNPYDAHDDPYEDRDAFSVTRFWTLPGAGTGDRGGDAGVYARQQQCVRDAYAVVSARQRFGSTAADWLPDLHVGAEAGVVDGSTDTGGGVSGCTGELIALETASHHVRLLRSDVDGMSGHGTHAAALATVGLGENSSGDRQAALQVSMLTAKSSALLRAGLYHMAVESLCGAMAHLDRRGRLSSSSAGAAIAAFGRQPELAQACAGMRAHLAEAAWRCGTWYASCATTSTLLSFALSPPPHALTPPDANRNDTRRVGADSSLTVPAVGGKTRHTHGRQPDQLTRSSRSVDISLLQTTLGLLRTACRDDVDDDADVTEPRAGSAREPVPALVLQHLGLSSIDQQSTAYNQRSGGADLGGASGGVASDAVPRSYQEAVLDALLATARQCGFSASSEALSGQGVRCATSVLSSVRTGFATLNAQLQPTTWLASMVAAEALKDIDVFSRQHSRLTCGSSSSGGGARGSRSVCVGAPAPPRWLLPVLARHESGENSSDVLGTSSVWPARAPSRALLPLEAALLDGVRLALCQLSGQPHWWRRYAQECSERVLTQTTTPQLALRWLRDVDVSLRLSQRHAQQWAQRLVAEGGGVGVGDTPNATTTRAHTIESEALTLAYKGVTHYAVALSVTDAERTALSLTHAEALYRTGARREAIALLQNIAHDGSARPFSLPTPSSRSASPVSDGSTQAVLATLLELTGGRTAHAHATTSLRVPSMGESLFQLPASAATDPRVVHRLMTWLHADAVAPLSQLVRDAYFTRCAVHDTTGGCSFLLARLCHLLARDIATRVRTYEFKKMQATLEDSRLQHRALVAQYERLQASGQLSDAEKRVLVLRIKNLQGDVEQEEREVLTEVRNYHLYRRSALNSYARYLQVTYECGDRDVHAVFGLAELWFQSEERSSGSTLLLEEDDDEDDGDDRGSRADSARSQGGAEKKGDASSRRPDTAGSRKTTEKARSSSHVTTEVLLKALTQIPTFRFIPLFSQLTARLGSGDRAGGRADSHASAPATTATDRNHPHDSVAAVAIGRRNTVRLYQLVERITVAHPLYTVWPLLALAHGDEFGQTSGGLHQSDRDKVEAAKRVLARVQSGHVTNTATAATAPATTSTATNATRRVAASHGAQDEAAQRTARYIQDARDLSAAYNELAAHKVTASTSRAHRIAPDFQIIEKVHHLSLPPPTMTLPTHTNAIMTDTALCATLPRIHRFHDRFTTPGGNNVPKVLVCVLSDGQRVRQLLKSNDDTRQDALIEQTFHLANALFLRGCGTSGRGGEAAEGAVSDHVIAVGAGVDHDETHSHCSWRATTTRARGARAMLSRPPLSVRTYNVVPLSPSTGVIEWVDQTMPLGEYIAGRFGSQHCTPGAHERYFPHEITNWDCRRHLESAGRRDAAARHQALIELYANYSPVMHYYFMENFLSVHDWLEAQQTYVRSVAASSLTGFAVGLGDRHGSNLLLHKETGELVHIDLGIAFDQSRLLPVPELVPFRLTRNIVDGFGVRGVDGGFRERCEEAMHILRVRRGLLLAVLEAFLYDPIAKWAVVARPLDHGDPAPAEKSTVTATTTRNSAHAAGAPSSSSAAAFVHGQRKAMRTTTTNSGDAQRTLARVEAKLKGYDGGEQLRVPAHVQKLIQAAQSTANLSAMFEGWSPWL